MTYRTPLTGVHRQLSCLLLQVGDVLTPKKAVIRFSPGCPHPTVMKDMCAECGADLRKEDTGAVMGGAGVAMVHAIPELRVGKNLSFDAICRP